jgi:hypothetical protein
LIDPSSGDDKSDWSSYRNVTSPLQQDYDCKLTLHYCPLGITNRKDHLMKHYFSKFGSSLMAVALIGVFSLTALAGTRPFHLVEHGWITATPRDASGTVLDVVASGGGTATHLGAITVERTAILTATATPGVFDFKGEATLTAASGEKLTTTITGTFNANIGHADLIYEWTGGTGRFEHATGTTFWSVDVANGEYDVVATGQIVY